MPIDPRLLTLTQWLSPAFPIGSFAYSHGLEQAVQAGWVHDAQSLSDWLRDILDAGSGKTDAIWIFLASKAGTEADILNLDAQARAYAPGYEREREAVRQGEAFSRVTSEVWALDLPSLTLPVALGRAARLLQLDVSAVVTLYLQSFAGNLVSAAQRLMPIGQTAGQQVLSDLTPLFLKVARQAETAHIEDIASSAFLSDIASMQHETLEPRLFQS